MSTWFREVCTLTVGDIITQKRPIISVEASTPVGTVLNLLKEENILSVPVYGTQGSWLGSGGVDLVSNHRQYIGIVSIVDLLAFILHGNPENVLNRRIVETIGSTNESLSLWVEPSSRPLFFVLERFCKGTHRALVHDEKAVGSPIRIVTQTDIVHFFIRHSSTYPHLGVVFDAPVGAIVNPNVDIVSVNATMREALEMLLLHPGIPVVNEEGSIITTLSASDLRGVANSSIALFHSQTVQDFLFILYQGGTIREPLMVSVDTSIRDAAKMMYRNRVHRLWVTVSTETPRGGVITYTDIIRAIHTAEMP